jgi:hypothetical protein
VVRQNILVVEVCGGGVCLPPAEQEEDGEISKGPGSCVAYKDMSLVTYFLHLGSIS